MFRGDTVRSLLQVRSSDHHLVEGSGRQIPGTFLTSRIRICILIFFNLFIWLRWVLAAALRVCVASHGIFIAVHGLSNGVQAYQLLRGMWDLSSPTGDQTHFPCIVRWILKPLGHQGSPRTCSLPRFLGVPCACESLRSSISGQGAVNTFLWNSACPFAGLLIQWPSCYSHGVEQLCWRSCVLHA